MICHCAWTKARNAQGLRLKSPVAITRYFFANPKLKATYAHKEAHKTPGGKIVRYRRLPRRKGAPGARGAR